MGRLRPRRKETAIFDNELLGQLEGARKRYEEEVTRILASAPESRRKYVTVSGLEVRPTYSPADIAFTDFSDISFPGQYPYTRGVFPAGLRSRDVHIRQVAGVGTAEETNKRWKFLLSQGATALSVVGLRGGGPDADHETMVGFTGKDGIVADSFYDYETLFDGIDLRKYTVHLITGSAFALANYVAIAEKQGIPIRELRGSMSNGLRATKECLDIIEYCTRNIPLFNSGYVDMRNTREAGCTATQEIAFGIALAMATTDELMKRGLDPDSFLPRMTWFINSGPEFFEEVAKFRALRRLWAKTFKEKYDVKNPRSMMVRMHCQTYAPTLTRQQPFNNLIRSTLYALPAIMGGVQSLSVNSFDEALAIPTEFSASLSVRTQQIIDLETGITSVVDPMGGSYYVEYMTNKLETEAQAIIDQIQAKGGSFKANEWIRDEIRQAALEWQQAFDRGDRVLVGANVHRDENDVQMRALRVLQEYADFEALYEYDPAVRDKQIARTQKVRRERDNEKLQKAMKRLEEAIKGGENIMPPMVEAVKCYMTQGDWGEFTSALAAGNQAGTPIV